MSVRNQPGAKPADSAPKFPPAKADSTEARNCTSIGAFRSGEPAFESRLRAPPTPARRARLRAEHPRRPPVAFAAAGRNSESSAKAHADVSDAVRASALAPRTRERGTPRKRGRAAWPTIPRRGDSAGSQDIPRHPGNRDTRVDCAPAVSQLDPPCDYSPTRLTPASAAKTAGAAPAQAGAVTGGFVCCKLWLGAIHHPARLCQVHTGARCQSSAAYQTTQ
jgi:hypothetical protein